MSIAIKNQLILILETLKRATKIVSTSDITQCSRKYNSEYKIHFFLDSRDNPKISTRDNKDDLKISAL